MANEYLFAGGRLETVEVLGGAVISSTLAGSFDSNYADASILVPLAPGAVFMHKLYNASAGILTPATVVSGETFFLHFEVYGTNDANSDDGGVIIRDSADFPWILLRHPSAGILRFYYNSGTGASPVWTLIGANIGYAQNTRYTFDFEIIMGSPHTANLYLNGSLIRSGTFTQELFTNIHHVHYRGLYRASVSNTHYSQILATRGIATMGAKVKTIRAAGAGHHTGWTGNYASVNEAVNNDATIQSAPTAGLISTHVMGDVTVPSGFEIKTVFHWTRAKNDGTGPTNLKTVLRSSGVDYSTGNLSGIGLGYGPIGSRHDLDPLGVNWTAAVFNALEIGYEAAT